MYIYSAQGHISLTLYKMFYVCTSGSCLQLSRNIYEVLIILYEVDVFRLIIDLHIILNMFVVI